MIRRVLEIIKNKQMSPAQFAEVVGIQRSSISHLVTGRNKPSLEFIQKILVAFPDISTEWLLTGRGEMLAGQTLFSSEIPVSVPLRQVTREITNTEPEPAGSAPVEVVKQIRKKKPEPSPDKQVEKIVYFYKDQTFREYYPDGD